MNWIENKYVQRIGITAVVAAVGWFVRQALMPGMKLFQHIVATIAFIVFIQIVWEIYERVHRALNRWMPFSRYLYGRIIVQLASGVAIMLVLRWAMMYPLQHRFPAVFSDDVVTVMLIAHIVIAIAINMIFISAHFIQQWKEELLRVARIEKEKAQLQYHHLKNQVNPHFLFNALTSLDALVKSDPALASHYINHLSKVYRYVLDHEEREVVGLALELGFIQHYIALQRIRFREALTVDIALSPEAGEKKIVLVTLQMLIDNAIKHNEIHPARPLTIRIHDRSGFLVVTNNVQSKALLEPSTRQGLRQLVELYGYLSDRPVKITGTDATFMVEIPLL
ncbi:histidine kinase [Fulvivirgaceae bacterium PWU5]|uniref:Histidine kinase n=1 Tax=Dawidia cretensis TaxID=2782350 RepID=A0AAP2GW19_9BACT|nr:sensor histidine kinase [Dawidia cretensis]MBT1711555.1 histidine kinase [Dawidia cretensis]